MVGIVLVSHSADLAAAVKALAEQQTQGRGAIAAVGGTDDPQHPFGTDAMAILAAIQSVYSDDGVLVLMDLGSALMSTEMAIEFLDEAQRPHVRMSQAPFVEGAMAASVQASIGMDLAAVAREAAGALGPKAASLPAAEPPQANADPAPRTQNPELSTPNPAPVASAAGVVTLVNPAGLHFGPAVQFVQMAAGYAGTEVLVGNLTTGAGPVDARRFNQVLGLGAEQGHTIEIRATGPDAPRAVQTLSALAAAGFGEVAPLPGAESPARIAWSETESGQVRAQRPAPPAPGPLERSPTSSSAEARPVSAGVGGAEGPAGATPRGAEDAGEIMGRGRLVLRGIPASPGVAVGVTFVLQPAAGAERAGARTGPGRGPAPAQPSQLTPDAEWFRYQEALAQAQAELAELARRMGRELGPEHGRIFQAHALLLADPDWTAAVAAGIRSRGLTAESAVSSAAADLASQYEAMSGPRFRERGADVRDAGARVVRLLAGPGAPELTVAPAAEDEPAAGQATYGALALFGARDGPPGQAAGAEVAAAGASGGASPLPRAAVIIADDLAPSQTAGFDRRRVVAFCTALGGSTSHTAILARGLGIPAVVGLGAAAIGSLSSGVTVAVDGATGLVIVEPDPATLAAYQAAAAAELQARATTWAGAQVPAQTKDGQRVEVVANLATAADARAALAAGAEGVGLLRTEFLFQDRHLPPTEEEQYAAYHEVATVMAPRPVIIRTLDIGGDKPAPYLSLPAEMNPFLGWRAIRVCLAMPDFFKVQLRAILRAALSGNVLVMFPMIAQRSEVEQARALLADAERELAAAGVPHAGALPIGIMVEVPAAAETPDLLAPVVDFFSIGTNDLTQYTFAADRGNARVAGIGDPLHPAVLRQIARVIDAAHSAGKWVGLCGELAGRTEAIPVLLGLGLDEFSMSAASIPAAKATLARLSLPAARALAHSALHMPDAPTVAAAGAALAARE